MCSVLVVGVGIGVFILVPGPMSHGCWLRTLCPCVHSASSAFQAAWRSLRRGRTENAGQPLTGEGHSPALQQPGGRRLGQRLSQGLAVALPKVVTAVALHFRPLGLSQPPIFWVSGIRSPQMPLTHPALQVPEAKLSSVTCPPIVSPGSHLQEGVPRLARHLGMGVRSLHLLAILPE